MRLIIGLRTSIINMALKEVFRRGEEFHRLSEKIPEPIREELRTLVFSNTNVNAMSCYYLDFKEIFVRLSLRHAQTDLPTSIYLPISDITVQIEYDDSIGEITAL